MKKLIPVLLIMFFGSGCLQGSNRMMNNENTMGMVGGLGAGVGSALLTSKSGMSGTNKALVIGGTSLLGYFLGSKLGKYWDDRDKKHNRNLIQKVLEENQDNETGTIQYSKSWSDPNGNTQTGMVTQSVTPKHTYQSQHLGSDGKPLHPSGYNDSLYASNQRSNNWHTGSQRSNNSGVAVGKAPYGYGSRPLNNDYSYGGDFYNNHLNKNRNSSGGGYCRDITVDIEISGLTATPQRTQFYKFCRSESGWRQVQ